MRCFSYSKLLDAFLFNYPFARSSLFYVFIVVTLFVFKILRKSSNDEIFTWRNIENSINWNVNMKNCEFCKDYVIEWIWDHLFAEICSKTEQIVKAICKILLVPTRKLKTICQKSTSTAFPSYPHAIRSPDKWDRTTVLIADRKSVVRVL